MTFYLHSTARSRVVVDTTLIPGKDLARVREREGGAWERRVSQASKVQPDESCHELPRLRGSTAGLLDLISDPYIPYILCDCITKKNLCCQPNSLYAY